MAGFLLVIRLDLNIKKINGGYRFKGEPHVPLISELPDPVVLIKLIFRAIEKPF